MKIRTRNEQVQLFKDRERLRLLQISDIHVWFSRSVLNELQKIIHQAIPDLIILTGDYYDTPRGACLFREFLSELANSFTIVFIKGNHDFLWGRKVFEPLLRIPNCFCVDEDLFSFISRGGNKVNIGSWKHRPLFEQKSHETNILLIHNPEKLKPDELGNIGLVLAGHLHGGQFIFFTYKGAHYPGSLSFKYCTDRKLINGTTLIVSKGVGDTFPFRFNCPRELVSITIT